MSKWSEFSVAKQLGIIIGGVALVTVALFFLVYKPISDTNDQTAKQLASVKAENDQLRPYENKLTDLENQIAALKQQLEIQKRIVPDEKEEDQFIHLVQGTASSAGVEIRSYTAKPTTNKEFFTEAPFDLELDGPYYSVLTFYDKLAKLDRIVNVSNLTMGSVEKPEGAKVKHHYPYQPAESVVASCTATTYFSHDPSAPANPAPGPGKKK